jgi:Rho-binding antiterminator
MEEYKPIDCGFYDRLEAAAVQRKTVKINYIKDDSPITSEAVIKDLRSVNGAEFLILTDGTEIRLDRIISLDGIAAADSCKI